MNTFLYSGKTKSRLFLENGYFFHGSFPMQYTKISESRSMCVHACVHSYARPSVHSMFFISFVRSFARACVHAFIHLSFRSFVISFMRALVRASFCSFVHSLVRWAPRY